MSCTPAIGKRRAVFASSNFTAAPFAGIGAQKSVPAEPYTFVLPVRKKSFIFAEHTWGGVFGGEFGGVNRYHSVTSLPDSDNCFSRVGESDKD